MKGLSLQKSDELSPLAFHSATRSAQISSLVMRGSVHRHPQRDQPWSVQRIPGLIHGERQHMRPVRHFRPWRIQAHVTISVLALLLERIAEIRAGDTWRNLAARLGQIKVVEYDRADARVLQTTEVREETAALLKQLGVSLPPRFHAIEPAPASTT